MDIPKSFLKEIEVGFLKELIRELRAQEIHAEDAKALSRFFLAFYPFKNLPDLKEKIGRFVLANPKFKELPIILARYEDSIKTQAVIERMRKHLKAGDIDKAVETAI